MPHLLILGPYPPPIGGVTVHVQRLLQQLVLAKIDHTFVDIKRNSLFAIFRQIIVHKNIHLHTSHSYLRFLICFFCLIFFKKLIFTFHGNVGRYGWFRNLIDRYSIKLATIPIVLNESSQNKAIKWNKNARKISAFIPPLAITELDPTTKQGILNLRKNLKQIFCTNAYNVSYDSEGNEVYQISKLVEVFNHQADIGLVISDPSGEYNLFFKHHKKEINNNIFFIDYPHDFIAVIKESDGFIRFTTTDGDSLSVKEALLLGKLVIATDVVTRPRNVILIANDTSSLISALKNCDIQPHEKFSENAVNQLFDIYNSIGISNEANHPIL